MPAEQLPASTELWASPLQKPDEVKAQASSGYFLSDFSASCQTDYHILLYVITY